MEEKEFQKLKDQIKAYKNVKEKTKHQINQIHQDVKDQKRHPWHAEAIIDELYKELYDTPERKIFSNLAEQTTKDSEYEKYFRAAFSEIFLNKPLDPKTL